MSTVVTPYTPPWPGPASEAEAGSVRLSPTGEAVAGRAIQGTDGRLADARPPYAHGHPQTDVTNLVADLGGKAATSYAHAQADVTGLVTDLAAKAALVHTHVQADVTGLVTDLAARELTVNKGAALGYASLDAAVRVPVAQLGSGTPDGAKFLRDDRVWATPAGGGGGSAEAWEGVVVGCQGNGNPNLLLRMMLHNPLNATPTNIGTTVARICYFRLKTGIVVANIRWFGVGAVTSIYHVGVYRDSDSVRMSGDHEVTTAAQAWGVVASAFTLAADTLYFVAVSADTTGTTAGILCHSSTTGRIGVLPTSWPGSLDINKTSPVIDVGFAQFAVTAGVLPATAPARALQAAWTGGMPGVFLDSV